MAKKSWPALAFGGVFLASFALAGTAVAQDEPTGTTDVEIVVDADDALSDSDVKEIGLRAGVRLALNSVHSDDANLYVGNVSKARKAAVLKALSTAEGIESAEANGLYSVGPVPSEAGQRPQDEEARGFPNDPLYQYQWHLDQIHMKKAWKSATGKGAVVAVIDTGVAYKDASHGVWKQAPDLKGTKFVPGYDFVSNDDEPIDEHGHGTHVAGTIAQTTNNGYGVAGVAYKSAIMPLRVLNGQGYGSSADIADSIRFAADNGAHVINMSLGGPLPSLAMRSAVRHAHKKGVTIVAAAGNSGRRMRSFPAAYKHVIAVAATQYDKKTTFYSQWGSFVDIAAPGGNTRIDQNGDGRPDGVMQQTLNREDHSKHDFSLYMGTSMAAPHVAGVAALLVSKGVTNPDKVESILKDTASDEMKGKVGEYEERYGAGLMDASAAARKATTWTGAWRAGLAGVLSLFLLGAVRRRDTLGLSANMSWAPFVVGLTAASSGLFFLPELLALIPGSSGLDDIAGVLAAPVGTLDHTLLGPSFHQNALLASCIVPLAGLAFGHGNTWLRSLGVGVAVGYAAFLFVGAYDLAADVQWIPFTGLLDRTWLAVNGVLSLGLAYIAMKRA